MPFTLTGDVFMFCCYNIHFNENCLIKEQAFWISGKLLVVCEFVLGFWF